MSDIIKFQFEKHDVQVITDDQGEPWFVAKEISAVLDYSDAEAMTRRLDDDEKQNRQIVGFGPRGITIINESGLYSAILGSAKPEAKPFKRWVTHDVLPAIRKTGSYGAPKASPVVETIDATKLFQPCFRIARLIGCDKQAAAISANQAVQSITGKNVLQLLGQTHLVADNQDALYFTPTELGKRIGTSARGMNLLLAEAGFQMKRNDAWEVTDAGKDFARIYDTGKKHGSGVPVQQIKWAASVLPVLGKDSTEAA